MKKSVEKQAVHSLDAAKVLQIRLKSALEDLCLAIFGYGCEMRWIDAYFPFTHPSFELEVNFEGQWLEVLGCGVMEQQLLKDAGVGHKVGWAFGLGKYFFIKNILLFFFLKGKRLMPSLNHLFLMDVFGNQN